MRKNTDMKSGWEEIKNDFNRNYFFCLFAWLLICLLFGKPINQLLGKLGSFLFSNNDNSSGLYILAIFILLYFYTIIKLEIQPIARWLKFSQFINGSFPFIKFGVPIIIWYLVTPKLINSEISFNELPNLFGINIFEMVYFFLLIDLASITIYSFPKRSRIRENKSSFSTDIAFDPQKQKQKDELGFDKFANRIASEIKAVSSSESVVFGINGEWGEGKTSMINLIRQQLEDEKYTVVDFHPWKTNSGKAMNQLFFDALKEGLKNKIWGINWKIDRYADALLQLDKTGVGKVIWQFISQPDSVEKQKEKLAESMKLLDKNLVVVVDDLDRLAKNEIADVLKLMRDTANFPNLVFLAAYDRAYLNEAIKKEINEHNYESYMDKIVLWEAPIYRPQPRKYLEVLKNLLKEKLPEFVKDIEEIFDESSSRMTKATYDYIKENSQQPENTQIKVETPYELHIALFTNLRTVKRFCNYLNFNIRTIKDKIIFADFYYLYLLRFFFSKQFDLFTTAYHELHRVKKGDFDEIERDFAKYTSIIFTNDNREKEKEIVAIVEAILRNVINNNSNTKFESLVYYKNFLNYFHLGNHNEITAAEFSAMLKANNIEEIKPKIDRISKDILNQFSNNSIIRALSDNFPLNDTQSVIKYFQSMILMSIKCDHWEFYQACHDRMEYICSNTEFGIDAQQLQKELSRFILDEQIQSDFQYFIFLFSKNLRKYESYLSKDFAFEIAKENFNNYISSGKEITPELVNLFYCISQLVDKNGNIVGDAETVSGMKQKAIEKPNKFIELIVVRYGNFKHSSNPDKYSYWFVSFLLKIFANYDEFVSFLKNNNFGNETERAKIYLKYIDQAFPDKNIAIPYTFLPEDDDYKNIFAGLDTLDILLDWKLRARIDEMKAERINQTN